MLAKRAGLPIKNSYQDIPQKTAIKKATYTLVFGGGERSVTEALLSPSTGQPLTAAQAQQFLDSDVVKDVLKAQQARKEQYKKDGGVTDIFDRWLPYKPDKTGKAFRSLVAQELQAYELYILKPGLDYLMNIGVAGKSRKVLGDQSKN